MQHSASDVATSLISDAAGLPVISFPEISSADHHSHNLPHRTHL